MKYHLKLMMGKEHEDIAYDLFPKNIRYVCKSDGAKLRTTGIALRIAKRLSVSEQVFREGLVECWSNLTIKSGGTLAIKFFIPFGKESTLWDSEMTNIIDHQNLYLQPTEQIIVRNLNEIDEEIDLEVKNDVDMDGAGTTIREMSVKHIDNKGNASFHSIEHTHTYGVYMLLFDETKMAQVDTLLATIDDSLDALGDRENADTHFRYHTNEKLNIVGIQPRGEQSDFWWKHFAGFVKTTIPTEIDTARLHQPPKGPRIVILPADTSTLVIAVILRAQLRPKLLHIKHDQDS
jgi:hypothetical protein